MSGYIKGHVTGLMRVHYLAYLERKFHAVEVTTNLRKLGLDVLFRSRLGAVDGAVVEGLARQTRHLVNVSVA